MRTIEEIKKGLKSKNQDEWVTFDEIDWIINQAEKVEKYELALRTISEMEKYGFRHEYVIKRYAEYARNVLYGKS